MSFWPDDMLWNWLSGDKSRVSTTEDTYDRVSRTYDAWKSAVEDYDSENQKLFGSASTCSELSDNVVKWLTDFGFPSETIYDEEGKHTGYYVVNGSKKIKIDNLDDLLFFARGIAKAAIDH